MELLTALERPTRKPLPLVLSDLHRDLDWALATRSDPVAFGDAVSRCFNRAALVECVFGRAHAAADLCLAQLSWVDGLARRTGQPELLLNALQAWINLARLDRVLRRPEAARSRLDLLLGHELALPIALRHVRIDGPDWQAMNKKLPQLSGFLQTVWLSETLLSLLSQGCYDRVTELRKAYFDQQTHVHLQKIAAEAELLAICRTQRDGGGVTLDMAHPLSDWDLDVLTLRAIELRLAQDRTATALWATPALGTMLDRVLSGPPEDRQLALAQHLIEVLVEFEPQSAAIHGARAFDHAVKLDDEVFCARFADICLQHGTEPEVWQDRCATLRDRSWYAAVRRRDLPVNPDWCVSVDGLTDRLRGLSHR